MKHLPLILSGAALLATGAAQAAHPVNVRQLNQERRIDAGARSGKLSPGEAARLKAQQRDISRYTEQLRAAHGGKLTDHDKMLIHARQDSANALILKRKNNRVRGKDHLPF